MGGVHYWLLSMWEVLIAVYCSLPVIYSIWIIFGHILYIHNRSHPTTRGAKVLLFHNTTTRGVQRHSAAIHHPTARGAAAQARTRRAPLSLSSRHSTADRLLRDERGMLRKCFPLTQKMGNRKLQPTAECDWNIVGEDREPGNEFVRNKTFLNETLLFVCVVIDTSL